MPLFLPRTFIIAPLMTALLALLSPLTVAQDSVIREETQFEDWLVQCVTQGDQPRQCAAVTRALNAAGDRDLGIISVQLVPEGQGEGTSPFRAFLTIPTNIAIQPGVGIEIDGNLLTRAAYEFCTQQNCRAAFQLGDELLTSMTTGLTGSLALTDIQGQVQRANFFLTGFAAALDQLNSDQ